MATRLAKKRELEREEWRFVVWNWELLAISVFSGVLLLPINVLKLWWWGEKAWVQNQSRGTISKGVLKSKKGDEGSKKWTKIKVEQGLLKKNMTCLTNIELGLKFLNNLANDSKH